MTADAEVKIARHTPRKDTWHELVLYVSSDRVDPKDLPVDHWLETSDVRVVHYYEGRTDIEQLAKEICGLVLTAMHNYCRLIVMAPQDSTAVANAVIAVAATELGANFIVDDLVVGEPGQWPSKAP